MDSRQVINECKVAVYRTGIGLLDPQIMAWLMRALSEVEMKVVETEREGTFEAAVDSILSSLREVMISKQRDYGPRNVLDCGETGVVIRVNDKLARLRNLYGITDGTYKMKSVSNETIEDSFIDLANYAIIALMLRRGTFDRPLGDSCAAGDASGKSP